MTSNTLDKRVYDQILEWAASGDRLADQHDYGEAIRTYNRGWELLPEPKCDWEASTWLLAAIADAAFRGGFLVSARQALDYVMLCPDAVGNPFLHLRRGQVLYEQNEFESAADELTRAYMGAGSEIFHSEDSKYMAFLKTQILLG